MPLKKLITKALKSTAKRSSVLYEYVIYRQALKVMARGGGSQSNEAEILARLVQSVNCPKTFCEFGFHPKQFNCIDLLRSGFGGLLIDGDARITKVASKVLTRCGVTGCTVWNRFLTLDNLEEIKVFFAGETLGVLSIDVDGNDYWFLRDLLDMTPSIIVVEYNASLGMESLSVPYDSNFVRQKKHASGWYHGASIKALTGLCRQARYSLVDVSVDGLNLFFLRNDVKPRTITELDPETAYKENLLRNKWSGTVSSQQWATIRDLPFVNTGP
jgi:hypothetical protein